MVSARVMPTIRERFAADRTKAFHVQVRMSGFPSRTASFPTRRAAERWAKTIEAEMIEGRHFRTAESRRRTVAQAIERYLLEELPKKRAGNMHRNNLPWWKKKIGHLKLADVTPAVLADHRGKLGRETYTRAKPESKRSTVRDREPQRYTRTSSTVNRYLAVLSHVFTVARKEWHWIAYNPFDGVAKLNEGAARARFLSLEERQRLLAATAKDAQLHTFVVLALSTAARAGELWNLKWRDVDLEAGRLHLQVTKNAQPRTAWVSGEALRLLKEHAERRAGGRAAPGDQDRIMSRGATLSELEGRVFTSATGKRYRYDKPFTAACTAAKIEDFTFHGLRHSAATYLAREGATEQQLRAIGGWKSNVVSRYVHLAAEDGRAVLEKMNKKILGGADAKETEKQ
jgi:integrase